MSKKRSRMSLRQRIQLLAANADLEVIEASTGLTRATINKAIRQLEGSMATFLVLGQHFRISLFHAILSECYEQLVSKHQQLVAKDPSAIRHQQVLEGLTKQLERDLSWEPPTATVDTGDRLAFRELRALLQWKVADLATAVSEHLGRTSRSRSTEASVRRFEREELGFDETIDVSTCLELLCSRPIDPAMVRILEQRGYELDARGAITGEALADRAYDLANVQEPKTTTVFREHVGVTHTGGMTILGGDGETRRLWMGDSPTMLGGVGLDVLKSEAPEGVGGLAVINARHPGVEHVVVTKGKVRFSVADERFAVDTSDATQSPMMQQPGLLYDGFLYPGDTLVFKSSYYHRCELFGCAHVVGLNISRNIHLGPKLGSRLGRKVK